MYRIYKAELWMVDGELSDGILGGWSYVSLIDWSIDVLLIDWSSDGLLIEWSINR